VNIKLTTSTSNIKQTLCPVPDLSANYFKSSTITSTSNINVASSPRYFCFRKHTLPCLSLSQIHSFNELRCTSNGKSQFRIMGFVQHFRKKRACECPLTFANFRERYAKGTAIEAIGTRRTTDQLVTALRFKNIVCGQGARNRGLFLSCEREQNYFGKF
jgi:hypothetical protein